MQLPHEYTASANAEFTSHVTVALEGMPDLTVAPPANFGGPGDLHSPEDLQVAAVASCFILSFKAVAAASKLEWESLSVKVEGALDRVERAVQFTEIKTSARLLLAAGASREKGERLLEKAEQTCFITNSLKADKKLSIEIEGGD